MVIIVVRYVVQIVRLAVLIRDQRATMAMNRKLKEVDLNEPQPSKTDHTQSYELHQS